MSPAPPRPAPLVDLAAHDGKAERVAGGIVPLGPTGHRPNLVAFRIARGLDDHARATGRGVVSTATMGFAAPELPSGRESFSPDAAYHDGPLPDDDMEFVPGPPTFAVEVRSEGDYGSAAEATLAAKRADYFRASTLAVWDVDPHAATIRSYCAAAPDHPARFARGHVADAEPAVPGWRMAVDDAFA